MAWPTGGRRDGAQDCTSQQPAPRAASPQWGPLSPQRMAVAPCFASHNLGCYRPCYNPCRGQCEPQRPWAGPAQEGVRAQEDMKPIPKGPCSAVSPLFPHGHVPPAQNPSRPCACPPSFKAQLPALPWDAFPDPAGRGACCTPRHDQVGTGMAQGPPPDAECLPSAAPSAPPWSACSPPRRGPSGHSSSPRIP